MDVTVVFAVQFVFSFQALRVLVNLEFQIHQYFVIAAYLGFSCSDGSLGPEKAVKGR